MERSECVLAIEVGRVSTNVCPYYMKSVGPGDPVLFDEYVRQFPDGYPLKSDKSGFPDKCERCQSEVKREQAKRRMKNKRVKDTLNNSKTVTF